MNDNEKDTLHLEVVHKKPTYHKFESAYSKLRDAEHDLINHNYNMSKYDGELWKEIPKEKQSSNFKYDDKPFKEIQTNVKHPFPTNIKYDVTTDGHGGWKTLTPNKDPAQSYPKSEYAIRYKALADEIADQDKSNQADKQVDAGGYVEERRYNEDGDEDDEDGMNDEEAYNVFKARLDSKPYSISNDLYWKSPGYMIANNLMPKGSHPTSPVMHQDGKLVPSKKRATVNALIRVKGLDTNGDFEKTVNTPLSKYYKYVNDDDHWVNSKTVELDDDNQKGDK